MQLCQVIQAMYGSNFQDMALPPVFNRVEQLIVILSYRIIFSLYWLITFSFLPYSNGQSQWSRTYSENHLTHPNYDNATHWLLDSHGTICISGIVCTFVHSVHFPVGEIQPYVNWTAISASEGSISPNQQHTEHTGIKVKRWYRFFAIDSISIVFWKIQREICHEDLSPRHGKFIGTNNQNTITGGIGRRSSKYNCPVAHISHRISIQYRNGHGDNSGWKHL